MDSQLTQENTLLMPLAHLTKGRRGIVARLEGGRRMTSRLADLGILPGVVLEVLRDGSTGPLLLMVRGTRLAIGRGMAERVLVRRCG
ncbi:MAG: FeoA family protein [bacterium]